MRRGGILVADWGTNLTLNTYKEGRKEGRKEGNTYRWLGANLTLNTYEKGRKFLLLIGENTGLSSCMRGGGNTCS
jgi:hypothetical protein